MGYGSREFTSYIIVRIAQQKREMIAYPWKDRDPRDEESA